MDEGKKESIIDLLRISFESPSNLLRIFLVF